jgi:hypothetical protein
MQLKTILNRVTNYKSFVVDRVEFSEDDSAPTIEVTMRARKNCPNEEDGQDASS